jgi:hypothetical protein
MGCIEAFPSINSISLRPHLALEQEPEMRGSIHSELKHGQSVRKRKMTDGKNCIRPIMAVHAEHAEHACRGEHAAMKAATMSVDTPLEKEPVKRAEPHVTAKKAWEGRAPCEDG